jgi:hypothetical protein
MNRERLLNLARAVREHPRPELFTMVHYATGYMEPRCPLACYAARTDLQSEFRLIPPEDRGNWSYPTGVGLISTGRNVDLDRGLTFAPELLKHFEINQDQARRLFGMYGCADARSTEQAAKFIESFAIQEAGPSPGTPKR